MPELLELPFSIPTDYESLSGAELTSLETQAREAAAPIISTSPDQLTTAQLERLAELRGVVTAVAAERTRRTSNASALADHAAAFNTAPDPAPTPAPAPDPAPTPDPAPAEPAPAITASARTAPRVGQVAAQAGTSVATPPSLDPARFAEYVINPDTDRAYNDWREVAVATERRLSGYKGLQGSGKHTIATLRREFSDDLKSSGDDDEALVLHATDPSRLPGGALTAAAGWCAPSQTIYDLCELETADGMIDLPEVQVTRGGIRFTPGPDFAAIFGGSGYFHQTEAQVIANTVKPCMEITCPAFTDVRLEVEGVCITGSILQRRGYPELVERFIRGAMVAHMHRLNAFVIAQLVAGSTAVTHGVDVPLDLTATSNLLGSIELTVEDLRYRNRLGFGAAVEIVLPHWARPVLRADLARRQGLAEFNVTDAMVDAWISLRGGRPQYVYDWQDAFSGLATGPGGAVPLTLYPNTIQYLAYPAGTWLRGSDDTIRLETIYDSANLATNRYTALFTEEGVLVAQVCNGGSRVVTVPFCPSGVTAAPVAFVCA